jgi:three-Cys-motif partner protein
MERYAPEHPTGAGAAARGGVKRNAADGLPARSGRIWTREKLTYLEKYASAFTTAMAGKWRRLVYMDLLAGPGRDIVPDTGEEFDGSPLIALAVTPKFDHLFLSDNDTGNIAALNARISAVDRDRVTIVQGDCNEVVDDVLTAISSHTLGLAFMDPQGFEVKFETLTKLAKRQIDLVYLFPSGIGVKRNLKTFLLQQESRIMDAFWGGQDWREQSDWKTFVSEYRSKLLRAGFKCQDEAVPLFKNTKNAQMYHLLYFSHHPIGLRIWKGVTRIEPGGQRKLPGID